jgi:two-component SAPR family response regulator
MAGIECDVVNFLLKADNLKDISAETVDEYENSIALFTGNYLEQNDYDWAYQRRIDIRQQYVQRVLVLAEFYRKNGLENKAQNVLIKSLKIAPVDKDINLQLLKVLKTRNDEVSIQRYYQLYKDRLNTEFGLEPDSVFCGFD